MNESRLNYLFEVYFNKTATHAERDELMQIVAGAGNDDQVKFLLQRAWDQFKIQSAPLDESQGDLILSAILQKQVTITRVPAPAAGRRLNWLRYTTAAVLLLGCITATYTWIKGGATRVENLNATNLQVIKQDSIMPGSNKAVLTLADGSHINLDSAHTGMLTKQGNAKLVNLNSATLAYNDGKENSEPTVYNTLSTYNGGQYHLELSDGTNVWLNASSTINYPTTFRGTERTVTITGEAYFEVAKNPQMPFRVKVTGGELLVLGTHFNVMAYNDENSMNTTLLEGAVAVSTGEKSKTLAAGQESRISRSGVIKIVDADEEAVMAWKNGWFQFNAYDIEKVMRQVARWYNVEIIYEGRKPTGHFTGSVSRENNISQVLKIMEAGGVSFKIEGRTITVFSDKI